MRTPKARKGQPIGFFLGQPNGQFPPGQSVQPPSPFTGTPPPFHGGGSSAPFSGPLGPGASGQPSGFGGLLQGLMGGNGSIDLPGIISNAQKMIGAVNQAGEVWKNISPMVQMLKNFDLSELASGSTDVITEQDSQSVKKASRRKKRRKRKRKARKKK